MLGNKYREKTERSTERKQKGGNKAREFPALEGKGRSFCEAFKPHRFLRK